MNMLKWIWSPLYDTCIMPAKGTERLDFFLSPIGVRGERTGETNLKFSQELGVPEQFILHGFAVSVPETSKKKDRDAIKQGSFSLVLGTNTVFFEQQMSIIPMNYNSKCDFEIDAKKAVSISQTPITIAEIPYKTGFYYLSIYNRAGFLIDGSQVFRGEIKYSHRVPMPGKKDIPIKVFLIGYHGMMG